MAEKNTESQVEDTQADDLPRPPSGRRAKSRPAGPPKSTELVKLDPGDLESKELEPKTNSRKSTAKSTRKKPSQTTRRRKSASSEKTTANNSNKNDEKPKVADLDAKVDAVLSGPKAKTPAPNKEAASALLGAEAPTDASGQVDKEKALESLAASLAGRKREELYDAPSDPDVNTEAQSEGDADDEEGNGQPRRRRRRGGRRRRRPNNQQTDSDGDQDETVSETKNDEGEKLQEVDPNVENSDDKAKSEKADEEITEGDGSSRRRRRRRRRGGSENDTAVRVREPRANPVSDEITAIEGSTRLEAKRQRRREGRNNRHRAPILTEAEFLARREKVNRKMVVRQSDDYTQLAVLEDDVLVEHYVDRKNSTSLIGNVYLGRVQNVLPSMEAVFIDIGRGRNAVLYAGEVNWEAFEVADDKRRVEEVFKSGQTVVVQVSKDPVGAKGARLTGHISIPGRYVVFSPDGHLSGISRKLPDTERSRLKGIFEHTLSESASVIVRTAAEGADEEDLIHDVDRLRAQWEVIESKASRGSAPMQLYSEPDLTLRTIRDLFTEDFRELVVSGHGGSDDAWETVSNYVNLVAPKLADRLTKWDSEKQGDLFAKYRIDEQIAKALERKVFLPSGGSLVIDRTEAMTVIDVNTGKFTGNGGNLEETITKNNLEAAEEIVRQLRLRDLGGIIVVDFIDMVLPANRDLLLRRLVECLSRDRTRHQVSEVTSLGLVQMTRKRIGTGLAEAFTTECEECGGRGYHRSDRPVASQAPADGGERRKKGPRRGSQKNQQAKKEN